MILLDVIGTEKVTEKLISSTDGNKGLMITLIVFLSINVIASIAKYFFDRALKKHDIKISKKLAITELSIKTEADLFLRLENLKNFQKGQSHEMLDSIIEIESFIATSRLFICKKIISLTDEQLDYYKRIISNYNEKDIRKEKEFTSKFSKQYYGE